MLKYMTNFVNIIHRSYSSFNKFMIDFFFNHKTHGYEFFVFIRNDIEQQNQQYHEFRSLVIINRVCSKAERNREQQLRPSLATKSRRNARRTAASDASTTAVQFDEDKARVRVRRFVSIATTYTHSNIPHKYRVVPIATTQKSRLLAGKDRSSVNSVTVYFYSARYAWQNICLGFVQNRCHTHSDTCTLISIIIWANCVSLCERVSVWVMFKHNDRVVRGENTHIILD